MKALYFFIVDLHSVATPSLISHYVYEWFTEDDRPVSCHHTHYRGRKDLILSNLLPYVTFPPHLQVLQASDYCLTHVQNLKISELEGATEVMGLAQSV